MNERGWMSRSASEGLMEASSFKSLVMLEIWRTKPHESNCVKTSAKKGSRECTSKSEAAKMVADKMARTAQDELLQPSIQIRLTSENQPSSRHCSWENTCSKVIRSTITMNREKTPKWWKHITNMRFSIKWNNKGSNILSRGTSPTINYYDRLIAREGMFFVNQCHLRAIRRASMGLKHIVMATLHLELLLCLRLQVPHMASELVVAPWSKVECQPFLLVTKEGIYSHQTESRWTSVFSQLVMIHSLRQASKAWCQTAFSTCSWSTPDRFKED